MKLLNKEFGLRLITGLFLVLFCYFIFFYTPVIISSIILFFIGMYCAIVELPRLIKPQYLGYWFVLVIFLGLPLAFLNYLNFNDRFILLLIIFMVALFDSFSYIVGKLLGKHKIAPSISPGKSWEGFCGGAFMVGTLYFMNLQISPEIIQFFGNCGIFYIILGALFGDLFESWLKRRAGLKDSGSILPGHGGILDRIDGLLGASLAILFYRWLFL
jgi:phosphatidate cytidylyltransferase